jgi:hypothetical protein
MNEDVSELDDRGGAIISGAGGESSIIDGARVGGADSDGMVEGGGI